MAESQCLVRKCEDEEERAQHAHIPQLLPQDGEHEVGMRLRQVFHLLDRVAEPFTKPAATTECHQRLGQLITAAERVGPGIEEGGHSPHPVGLGDDQGHHGAHPDQDEADELH
ncbi:hypothetical protein D3C85_1428380 [compost metagenome]